jgi:hypothetical protein
VLKPNLPPKTLEHVASTLSSIRTLGRDSVENRNTAIVAVYAIQEVAKYAANPDEMIVKQWQVFDDEHDAQLAQLSAGG